MLDLEALLQRTLYAPLWPEPVRIVRLQPRGSHYEVIAEGQQSQRLHSRFIDSNTLETLLESQPTPQAFGADPELFALGVEARRIQLGYSIDPFFAVSTSRIDPLPHQLEAVYGHMLHKARLRFLLADDPGAGKTIMAGLLLKELKYRGTLERILIITPANLSDQWRREMQEKFGERFSLLDRHSADAHYDENPWTAQPQLIASMDFAKLEPQRSALERSDWDLVIVDEAHKLSATRYGREIKKSLRYRLGEVLARNSHHCLFLSATPHQGNDESFRLLLALLEPDIFATRELLEEASSQGENPLLLRRLKEDMRDFDGRPLFPKRIVHTPTFKLSASEHKLYEDVSAYVRKHFKLAWQAKQRNVGLAMTVLQRRLASSSYAIARSLERRHQRLCTLYEEVQQWRAQQASQAANNLGGINDNLGDANSYPAEDYDDLPEAERWRMEDMLSERLTLAKNLPDLEREIQELARLKDEAKLLARLAQDRKLEQLRSILAQLPAEEKLLIFTEHKDSLDFLLQVLRQEGHSVTHIDGSMRLEDRVAAEKRFQHEVRILVATEAAGEGINLQFCAVMVNYDLPWNPSRLEQRMGRVHRYGQKFDVHIYNLVAENTREGEVLGRILSKLEAMRAQLGSDRVYDVIGELLSGVALERLIGEHLSGRKSLAEIRALVDAQLSPERLHYLREVTLEALAQRELDLSALRNERQQAQLQRLLPEYSQRFFLAAFNRLGGHAQQRSDGLWRVNVPASLRQVWPQLPTELRHASFDPQHSHAHDFLIPGQALFDAVLAQSLQDAQGSLEQGARFSLPQLSAPGSIAYLELAIVDGSGSTVARRLFACWQQSLDAPLETVAPHILIDALPYHPSDSSHSASTQEDTAATETPTEAAAEANTAKPMPEGGQESPADAQQLTDQAISWAYTTLLENFLAEVRQQRQREVTIRRKYGLRSLEHLLRESTRKLTHYKLQARRGEDMALAIGQEQRRQRDYQLRLERFNKRLQQEESLHPEPARPLAIARLFPLRHDPHSSEDPNENANGDASNNAPDKQPSTPYSSDPVKRRQVEQAAMAKAMAYEREHGRQPEDVSARNVGYDIYSSGRFIEVKGRASHDSSVVMSANEWITANRLGEDYYLYIVSNALHAPQLSVIGNPAQQLADQATQQVVQYYISAEAVARANSDTET